jgi:uncharacterized membrane protein
MSHDNEQSEQLQTEVVKTTTRIDSAKRKPANYTVYEDDENGQRKQYTIDRLIAESRADPNIKSDIYSTSNKQKVLFFFYIILLYFVSFKIGSFGFKSMITLKTQLKHKNQAQLFM